MLRGRVKPEYFPAAIEIGSNSLKLLQLSKIKSSYKIVKADYIAIEHNKGESVLTLKHSLEKLVKENQIKGEVATSLPLNKINTYTYILPNMPPDEIESALLWKLKQDLTSGINFDDISFDYVYSPYREDNKDIHVLVFMVPKKIVLDMVKFFKELSLVLIAVEPKPYLIIKALFLLQKLSEQETVLVLQLGASNSSITIVSSGYLYLIRPLAVSGNSFTETLASYYQFDWEKAEALKIKEGFGQCPALSSQLESLVIDIEHTFKYFSHQLVKSKVLAFDRVVLCGGSASLANLDKFLADKLGVPVVVFDPVDFFASHCEYEVSPVVKVHSTAFASVLGLATRFIEDEIKVS